MSWVRLDDRFPRHPKVLHAIVATGPEAGWLWVCALAWSSDYTTDGVIPASALGSIAPGIDSKRAARLASVLVDSRLWIAKSHGFEVHDYHDWQPSADDVRAKKKATAEKVAKWRKRAEKTTIEGECNPVTNRLVTLPPSPSPSPSPSQVRREEIPPVPTAPTPDGVDALGAPSEVRIKTAPKRGSRISPDWAPKPETIEAFRAHGIDAIRELPDFLDYWAGVAGHRGVKLDWEATFRNRIRELVKQGREPKIGGKGVVRAVGNRPMIQAYTPPVAPPQTVFPEPNFDFTSDDGRPADWKTA